MAIVFALLNALALSVSNVLGGVSAKRMSLTTLMLIAAPVSVVVALLYAMLTRGHITGIGILLGFAAGLLGGAGLPVAYAAFALGPAGVVGAVIALTSTVLITAAGAASGIPLTPLRGLGLVLCISAVFLVTYRPRGDLAVRRGGSALALVAAVLFTGFVLLIDRAPDSDGMWPLVGARMGVTTVALGMFVYHALRRRTGGGRLRLGMLAILPVLVGVLDVTGNFFLVLALEAGDLLLLAVLAPAAPIFTALIGRLFLNQSLGRLQIAGLAVASAALPFASV